MARTALPNREEIEVRLMRALARLCDRDRQLLAVDINERSITHRIAMYLQDEFSDWDVDAEYNRDHDRIKAVRLEPQDVKSNDTCGTTVFPDIIVHRRGTDENLLVVEAKKRGRIGTGRDKQKLEAYTLPREEGGLGYAHGVHIVLCRHSSKPELRWFAQGKAIEL
jgi:hypothetical protein